MAYVRWEYYESITVTYESRSTSAPVREASRISESAAAADSAATEVNRLLWVAPMALAAGAAIVREANRRGAMPRLGAAVKRVALSRGTALTRSLRDYPRTALGEGAKEPPMLESGRESVF